MRKLEFFSFLTLLVFVLWPPLAALGYNNPSLKWRTIKTEHFEVHYHEGAEWTARQVADAAERVHRPLVELYQYEPDLPVHFIIKDTDDYANGATYFYENKIELWASNLEFGYRGTTQWIRNVVTHEYTHMVSIQAGMKTGRRFPAFYFQLVTFEKEKRPDVLQGYPKDIVTYPLSGVIYPPWFAEGVAQYQMPGNRYDCWDTHRDMILRCALLEDKMLTYDEMGFFGKTSMGGEEVYDHGFGLVNYIASQYGEGSLREITKGFRALYRLSAEGAFKKVTGKSGEELYNDWKEHLRQRYEGQTAAIGENVLEGEALVEAGEKNGFMNAWPVFSPDGKQIAYLSNRGSDYAGTALYLMDRDGAHRKQIKGGVTSRPVFSSDGTKILYSRKHKVDRYGSSVNDLFVYDTMGKKETQLTKKARISDPDFSPDGRMIVGVKNSDGTHRIVLLNADGQNERDLYASSKGTQFYNPRFSPDGRRVLFGIFIKGTRDIAVVSTDGSGLVYLLETPNDERDASWTRGSEGILFSSDRTGIFNVYELDLATGKITKRTNVIGGAFNPDAFGDGALVYSHYNGDGYGISFVHPASEPVETLDRAVFEQRDVKPLDECAFLEGESFTGDSGSASPGDTLTALSAAPGVAEESAREGTKESVHEGAYEDAKYKSTYTSFQFYPRVVVWDGVPRFGLNMTSGEILDKQSFLVGGSYGTNSEYDAFLGYEIRNFYPTIFAEFILMRELYEDTGSYEEGGSTFDYKLDLGYELWQADLGLRLELSELYSQDNYHRLSAYWSHGEYRVDIEGDQFQDGEYDAFIKGGWKYYIGNEGILEWNYRRLRRATDDDINPRGGRDISFQYLRSFDQLFTSGEFEYGFKPVYDNQDFDKFTLDWREYAGLPYLRHSLRLRLFASVIDRTVDDFFWIYMGGRDGIRGYTYYSLGGKKAVLGSLTYRFPIWRNINQQLLHLYFRDLYGGVFFETANAWSSGEYTFDDHKNSAGLELRLSLGSFYLYPTTVSWVSAYSLDPVENVLSGYGTRPVIIRQEKGWSHYLTIGFGFDL